MRPLSEVEETEILKEPYLFEWAGLDLTIFILKFAMRCKKILKYERKLIDEELRRPHFLCVQESWNTHSGRWSKFRS